MPIDEPALGRPGSGAPAEVSRNAARDSGLVSLGRRLLLLDSIAAVGPEARGHVAVSGSHGGASAARYAIAARPLITAFNDAGGGKDDAGIVGLSMLQAEGLAAVTVAHTSARIGEARSTLDEGVISHVNAAAAALGARPGQGLRDWLAPVPEARSSPGVVSAP